MIIIIPWCAGKLLVWDVTVVSTLAESYVAAAARGRGEVAELAAAKKCEKYTVRRNLHRTHISSNRRGDAWPDE